MPESFGNPKGLSLRVGLILAYKGNGKRTAH